jgi:type I restriction enzyme, S subunit
MQYSIVNYNVIRNQADIRIDADYYSPRFLEIETCLTNLNAKEFNNYIKVITDGKHGGVNFTESGVRFLRNTNAKEFFIDDSEVLYISDQESCEIKRSEVSEGDILYTSIGTIGEALVVPPYIKRANINQNLVKIVIRNSFSPYYLTTFLNCKYGKSQSIRLGGGNVQGIINYPKIKAIKIFYPQNHNLITAIEKTYQQAIKIFYSSILLYRLSEQMLLSELGLLDWQPKHRLAFFKNYSDTQTTERMDAEYFQPKYEEIEKAIRSYSCGCSLVKDEFRQNKSVFSIDGKKTYPYIEIGSIDVSSGEITADLVEGAQLPANAKRVLKKDDVIVSKVRTYRGAIAIIDQDGYVGSGAFTVLREKGRINKETLFTFLRSKPLLAWSLKPNTGTSYPVIVDDDILNLPIPLFSQDIQTQIQQKTIESFKLRKQSKHLLECAKRAVEIAIEQDEVAAMEWLKQQEAVNSDYEESQKGR